MSEDALIGSTGFIGGTLLRARSFDACFNSANIETMRGREFRTIVCAGARAEKWKANREPEIDRQGIDALCDVLSTVRAQRFVLISTVDVFADPCGVDELSPVPTGELYAYGANRRHLETFVANTFPAIILRLPGVYGQGLRKNVIYDLLHANEVEKIDSRAVFQFYGVHRLNDDIGRALELDIGLMHLTTEPVPVSEIAKNAFGLDFVNEVAHHPARYDVRTRYASAFGGSGRYLENTEQVVTGVKEFVSRERAGISA